MTRAESLAALVVDVMQDGQIELRDVLEAVKSALLSEAASVRANADDYEAEDLDYWREVERQANLYILPERKCEKH